VGLPLEVLFGDRAALHEFEGGELLKNVFTGWFGGWGVHRNRLLPMRIESIKPKKNQSPQPVVDFFVLHPRVLDVLKLAGAQIGIDSSQNLG